MRRMDAITSGGGRALYINREKRKKRKKLIGKLVVWTVLILLICLIAFMVKSAFSFISGFSKDDFAFSFNIPDNWNEHNTITEIKSDYAIGIAYPLINEKTDKTIKKDAEKILEEFKKEIKQYKTGKKENRAVYTADFSITKNSDNYVSVVYSINRSNPLRDINDKQYKTKVYDIASGKEIGYDEIFNENYASIVSKQVVSIFESRSDVVNETSTNLFKKNTEPNAENFKNFSFSDGFLTLYFGAGQIFPSDMGAVTADIPLSKLYNDMNINVTGYTPPLYDPDKPMVALTFDDGPYKPASSIILDAVERTGARVTFFILGERVANEKETILRGNSLGCEYGNHTWNHANLSEATAEEINEQIKKTDDALLSVIGKESKLLRAPYAAVNDTVAQNVSKPFIGWAVDTEDWKNKDSASIRDMVLENISDGDIVLMHDLYKSTANAAVEIIDALIDRGFQVVTVSELMEAREINMSAGKVYYRARKKN